MLSRIWGSSNNQNHSSSRTEATTSASRAATSVISRRGSIRDSRATNASSASKRVVSTASVAGSLLNHHPTTSSAPHQQSSRPASAAAADAVKKVAESISRSARGGGCAAGPGADLVDDETVRDMAAAATPSLLAAMGSRRPSSSSPALANRLSHPRAPPTPNPITSPMSYSTDNLSSRNKPPLMSDSGRSSSAMTSNEALRLSLPPNVLLVDQSYFSRTPPNSRKGSLVADPSSPRRPSLPRDEPRASLCGTFIVHCQEFVVPLLDKTGYLPMDRRCTRNVFGNPRAARGALLLIPGFASNRRMFHLGGGVGKSGPCFSEFLAKRGFDVYSVDLRGTSEALELGARRAASMREYVEVDIPSAIAFVKKHGGYDKVYLIGHSMGGALSCAVAGHLPNDVAGVVHLAGLYHYTLPGLSEVIEVYKAFCPGPIKTVIGASTGLAARSMNAVFSPFVNGLLYLLGANSKKSDAVLDQQPDMTDKLDSPTESSSLIPKPPSALTTHNSESQLLTYLRHLMIHLKRQPIPLRTGLSTIKFFRNFVPLRIERAIMNAVYPSPWVPNSVEDPWGLMEASVESPSIGVYLSIAQMAIHHEFYNNWVMSSSSHRADVVSEDVDMSDQSLNGSKSVSAETLSENVDTMLKKASVDPLAVAAERGCPPPPAGRNGDLNGGSVDSLKENGSPPLPRRRKSSSAAAASAAADDDDTPPWSSWNELTPYLSKFEKLEHLPLFFCYANADGVIRVKDSMAGYQRSGSRWKDIVTYKSSGEESPVRQGPSRGGSTESLDVEIASERRKEIVEGLKLKVEQVAETLLDGEPHLAHADNDDADDEDRPLSGGKKVRFSAFGDSSDEEDEEYDDQLKELPKALNSQPTSNGGSTESVPSEKTTNGAAPSFSPPAMRPNRSYSSANLPSLHLHNLPPASASLSNPPPASPNLFRQFAIEPGYSYGHVDILGGVHAERMWEKISSWLAGTEERVREWKTWRRYSAR
ncbi:hypothetical protein DFS34DRAFT_311830 [Phlyctochytrium arcticum]|nr:hypothetical protein DFS34DRAFT_311830 [Phlyctochytrium arcticum]